MPGYFDNPFGDDDTISFFGGYRQPSVQSLSDMTGDATIMPVSHPARAPSSGASAILTYPDGRPVVDINTEQPYPRPDRLDMQKNLSIGQGIGDQAQYSLSQGFPVSRDLMFGPLFPAGSLMDYQRQIGHPFGKFDPTYTNASAYNYGAVGAAAGYDLEALLKAAGSYNLSPFGNPKNANTPYGLSQERVNNIAHGFSDVTNGLWSAKQPE